MVLYRVLGAVVAMAAVCVQSSGSDPGEIVGAACNITRLNLQQCTLIDSNCQGVILIPESASTGKIYNANATMLYPCTGSTVKCNTAFDQVLEECDGG